MAEGSPKPRLPQPGVKIRVIGAGLPRTGTNSFCAALEVLLKAPPYHTGIEVAIGEDKTHVIQWTDIIRRRSRADRSREDRQAELAQISTLLDGYVATADPPLSQMIPELMELYPDAKVICTVRDVDSWAESMAILSRTVRPELLKLIFFWLPHIRNLPFMYASMTGLFIDTYGGTTNNKANALAVWDRHLAWLADIVPKEKLFYVNVKDGWEPLCKALDVPVPEGVSFPRLNDSQALEGWFRARAIEGLLGWVLVVGIAVASVGVAVALGTKATS